MPISKPAKAPKDTMSEFGHQCALFEWAALAGKQRPELAMLMAIPNGGHRHKVVAAKLKEAGAKAGYPDLALNLPRAGYAGLFIELKTQTGRVSPEQRDWLDRLIAGGNRAVVCRGWLAAQTEIINYLDGTLND